MSSRSTLVIVGFALAALLGAVIKEMYFALAFEALVEQAAHTLNIPRADLIAAASPYVLALAVVAVAFTVAYRVGVRDRKAKSPLRILYDENNPQHVEPLRNEATRYYVDIFNNTTDRTIHNVRVTWGETPFTQYIDNTVRSPQPFGLRDVLAQIAALHPQSRQRVYLFGFDDAIITAPPYDDPTDHASHFTVRASGNDAAETEETFEYSPFRFPKLRRVS